MELSLGTSVKNQQIPKGFFLFDNHNQTKWGKQQLRKFVNNQQFQRNVLMFLPLANEVVLDPSRCRPVKSPFLTVPLAVVSDDTIDDALFERDFGGFGVLLRLESPESWLLDLESKLEVCCETASRLARLWSYSPSDSEA